MSATYAVENLVRCFGDLIHDPKITEIVVNADGRVWIERVGDPSMMPTELRLDESTAQMLGHDLAGEGEAAISAKIPLAGSDMVIEESLWRAQVVAPPTIDGGYSLALRRTVSETMTLSQLCDGVSLRNLVAGINAEDQAVFQAYDGDDFEAFLTLAVRAKWNILFSGGTSSGKTTWLRACLEKIPADERILTIEDVYELRPKQPNTLSMRSSEIAGSSALLKACLRLRPDRIMMGELRAAEAFDFLSIINSGHPGAISTLHATTPDGALRRLSKMVMQAGMGMSQADIIEDCRDMIDVIVQLSKVEGVRRPTAVKVFRPRSKDGKPAAVEDAA